jgi:CRISPR/Cas system endoribonuclease Cas6 (RAMP superfamily)
LRDAFGALRGAELTGISGDETPLVLPLDPLPHLVTRARVEFLTPTELKTASGLARTPEFAILATRIRDRISTLRQLYDDGPLSIDFVGFGQRAAAVRMMDCQVRPVTATRRSRATGQTHSLAGFVGWADYEGDLSEFLPYLLAAQWTGVGRQTSWGKGAVTITAERVVN